jgi:hypothetical protein
MVWALVGHRQNLAHQATIVLVICVMWVGLHEESSI